MFVIIAATTPRGRLTVAGPTAEFPFSLKRRGGRFERLVSMNINPFAFGSHKLGSVGWGTYFTLRT
jgi:hypothetical protein